MKKLLIRIVPRSSWLLAALAVAAVVALASCKSSGVNKPAKTDYYSCGMHPEVRSLDPDGKCPICQMPLLLADSVPVIEPDSGRTNNAATFPAVSGWFSCPMHPSVLTRNSADKCPDCGMKLLPVENPAFHQHNK